MHRPIRTIAGGRGAGETHDAPLDPNLDSRRLANVALAPYDSRFRRSSRIAVPVLWSHQIETSSRLRLHD